MKKRWIRFVYAGIFVCIIISIPLVMHLYMCNGNEGTNNIDKQGWISFLGTYIGACIGGFFTLISLIGTLKYYREEAESNKKQLLDEQKAKTQKYKEELDRKLLLEFRPYIIFDKTEVADDCRIVNIDRYVYASKESKVEWTDLENYDSEYDKMFLFKLRNVGLGPADNIKIVYNSSEYMVAGFDDRVVKRTGKDIPLIYNKMSIDIVNNDYLDVQLKLHFSRAMQRSMYTGFISLTFEYEDIRNNKLARTMSIDLNNGMILGWSEQKYLDNNNQALFDGAIEI